MMRNRSNRLAYFPQLAITFAWVLALSCNVSATSHEKTFRFNISPDGYPPYLIVEQEQPSGIVWDVVSLIGQRLGYDVIPKQVPRKRVDQLLLDNALDGTPRAREWTPNPDRFLFTDPIVSIEEVFFVPKDSDLEYRSPRDLYAKTIVTHLGYHYPELELDFDAGNIHRFDVARHREMFTFVLHGDRFDAAVADRLVGQWVLKKEGLQDQFRITGHGINQADLRIMLRRDLIELANDFNAELKTIRENGELTAILAKYR